MINKKPSLTFHPFVRRWMKKFSLVSEDTCTQFGYAANPQRDRFPDDFLFNFDDVQGDIERLNSVYGTSFDTGLLDARFPGRNTLRELIQQFSEVRRALDILPELKSTTSGIYICGLKLPKRNFLYLESSKLSEGLKEEYSFSDMHLTLLQSITFIPVATKYRPKF